VTRSTGKTVRIGGAAGFWGDSAVAAPQLVLGARIDYLMFDYLAELTMAILAAARDKKPELGYATDFVDIAMRGVLPDLQKRGIKVVSNAGGVNPRACADALLTLAREMGVNPKIAVVEGDDVSAQLQVLRAAGQRDMFTGALLPERILSANAYLGALPIAEALAAGADIVITGRCADSAMALGPLMHEFGWSLDDYDLLAAGSLAGHIIECGCQATGGLHTDWEQVQDWANIGYPIAECCADGEFIVTKPEGTGGLVVAAAVAEQMLYEIGDPAAYILPDVICDFRDVQIENAGKDRVRVRGARGLPPTNSYKVSATYADGFRSSGSMVIIGIDAVAKARRTGEAIITRTREMFKKAGLPDYSRTHVEVIGSEGLYGSHARASASREVMMRVVVDHVSKQALDIFAREIAPSGTSWSPGTTSPGFTRPKSSPLIKQFAFTTPKRDVPIRLRLGDAVHEVMPPVAGGYKPLTAPDAVSTSVSSHAETVVVPLITIAYARSGDKGDISNIGVIARRPEYLPIILDQVTPAAVKTYFSHLVTGDVERYRVPGIHACNFLLFGALDGGGIASMRLDPLGKGMAQMLLDMPIAVPKDLTRVSDTGESIDKLTTQPKQL